MYTIKYSMGYIGDIARQATLAFVAETKLLVYNEKYSENVLGLKLRGF